MTARVLVRFAVRDRLDALSARCRGQAEAGGILLGAYRGGDIEVTGMTEPGLLDKRRLRMFARSDQSHQEAADAAWSASGSTVTFLGEWHTHPAGEVVPSSTDVGTWRFQARRNERPMVYALAAPGQWGLFIVRPRLLWPAQSRLACIETGKIGLVFR